MKLIVFLIVSLFAVQQVTAVPDNTQRSLKDELAAIIATITNLINNTAEKILGIIDVAITSVKKTISEAINLVNATVTGVLNAINALEKKALDLGIDVAICVVDQKNLVIGMEKEAETGLMNTSDTVINGLNKIKSEALDTIQGYLGVVQKLLADFSNCGFLNVLCMGKVIADATVTSIKLTAELPAMALRITKIVTTTTAEVVVSATKITTNLALETGNILTETTKCVEDKIASNIVY